VTKEKLADVYAAMGKKREALEMYSSALVSYAKFNGPGSAHRIKPLTSMGAIQVSDQNYKGACENYNQAYILTQRSRGVASPEAMKMRLMLAAANRAANSYDKAATLYNESFELQKKDEKLIPDDQLVSSLQDYVVVLRALKKDDDAEKIAARVAVLQGGADAPGAGASSSAAGTGAEVTKTEVTSTTSTEATAK